MAFLIPTCWLHVFVFVLLLLPVESSPCKYSTTFITSAGKTRSRIHLPNSFDGSRKSNTLFFATTNPNNDDNENPKKEEFSTPFNPFTYQNDKSSSSIPNPLNSYSIISLRKTKMQQIVNGLLEIVESTDTEQQQQQTKIDTILQNHQEFLLEPLEDPVNSVLDDPDSIYDPNMTRTERYAAYRTSMEERLQKVRNPQVQKVLLALKEYVLQFE